MPPKKITIGKLSPKYSFVLNEYSDYRVSKCPKCNHNTFRRKFPLLIFFFNPHYSQSVFTYISKVTVQAL